jgi:flagellar basal body-associated protein FliL
MNAVEQLDYRVTVGDIAARAGLNINLAEQGLLALASEAGGHLQVAESGEIAYLFPKNFRAILRNKFLRLRLQEWWAKIWRILFYLIRISFGILLILSIVLIFVAIAIIVVAMSASSDNDNSGGGRDSGGGGIFFFPSFWYWGDIWWLFDPGYNRYDRRYRRQRPSSRSSRDNEMNFLEAIFSFLFGDGNPNVDLEERRWQEIGTVIRAQRGAVVAEQIAPYLDDLGEGYNREYEDYMLPVLTRFNGRPEVSPDGQIVYHFPDLQTTTRSTPTQSLTAPYLYEKPWRFSQASSGQIIAAIGLGSVNIIGALMLGSLLRGGEIAAQIGGLVAFVQSIYWLLLAYGIGFLTIPLIRYFWVQWKNSQVTERNQKRQARVNILEQNDATLQKKIAYAQQFAAQNVITNEDLAYTSETDLLDQELDRKDQIDAEWQRRLESGS